MKFKLSMASHLGAPAEEYPSDLNPRDADDGTSNVIGDVSTLEQLMAVVNSLPDYAGLIIFGSGPDDIEMPELMIYDDYIE